MGDSKLGKNLYILRKQSKRHKHAWKEANVFWKLLLCAVHVYRPISGGSMNPARTLGPAIATSYYKGLWVYFVGPITGAVLAAWSYNVIRDTEHPGFPISLSSISSKVRQSIGGTEQKSDQRCLVWMKIINNNVFSDTTPLNVLSWRISSFHMYYHVYDKKYHA